MIQKTKNKLKQTFLGRLWAILEGENKTRIALIVLLMMVSALVNTAGVGAILPFMSILTDPQVVYEGGFIGKIYELFGGIELSRFLLIIGTLVLIVFIVGNFLMMSVFWVMHRFSQNLSFRISRRLLGRYLYQDYSFFLKRNSSELVKNLYGEVGAVNNGVLRPLMEMLTYGVLAFAIISYLFFADPLIATLTLGVLGGAYGVIYYLFRKRLDIIGKKRVEANKGRFHLANEAFGGIKDVKLLGKEHRYLHRYEPIGKQFHRAQANVHIIAGVPKYLLEMVAFGGILLIALILYSQSGNVSGVLPLLSVYALAGYRLMPAVQNVFRAITTIRGHIPALDVVYHDFYLPPGKRTRMKESEKNASTKENPVPFQKEVSLEHISFRYSEDSTFALSGINMSIPKNHIIGIVGPTGCGKTTLVDVVLNLLIPESGRITVDGTPITDGNRRNWQQDLGYVPQAIYLSDDTITRNIAFGIPDEEVDMAAVRRSADAANIRGFIETELPSQYRTIVGERGVRLSGGQRQRVGIARALYHNPQVLILDEATSALDNITERVVMDAINNLAGKKTIIIIAHRLTTVMRCNTIYLMDKGQIVDSGSYRKLKESNLAFQKMVEE